MSDTSRQEPKSRDVSHLARLCRMLRSMSRKWPNTFLQTTTDGFGARLEDGRYLRIVYSGRWTDEDIRDYLVLFATWLVADPAALHNVGIPLDGLSVRAAARLALSSGAPSSAAAEGSSTRHSA